MAETLLSRPLVAVWVADIVGYSARAAEDETGALRLVEILQTLSRETVRGYGGRVVAQSISSVGASALVTGRSALTSNNGSKTPLVSSESSRLRSLDTRNAIGWMAFFADTSTAPPSKSVARF
jgi:class 3 adenylate cyclase